MRRVVPVVPLLAVGAFAIGTDTFVVAGVLPEVARTLRVSVASAGWVSTVFALAYAVAAPVLGALTGRLERRTVLAISLVGFTLGNVASALAPDLPLLLLARVLTAVSAALYVPAASASAAALAPPERRGRAMAVVLGGLSAATVVGVPFGTWVAADLQWRVTFWLLAAVGAACAVAVAVGLPALRLPSGPGLAVRLAPVRETRVGLAVLTTALFMTGGYLALTYVGALLAPATDGDGTVLAVLLLVFGVPAVAGTVLGGRATDRWGALPVLLVAVAGLAVVLATLPLTRQALVPAGLAMAVWGVTAMATQPAQQHRLFAIAPGSGPLLLSLNSSATFVGIALGGFLGNRLLRHGGVEALDLLGPVGAALCVLALGTALLGSRTGNRPDRPVGAAGEPARPAPDGAATGAPPR
ncbi:Predicted arabinose efflux permease, MFS family [Micromonospora purpureochromogenes]|uniref:Predicted arabinose efflux permease, MFS family n=2 Tax=Micromonospora purpureochromogenes TaxID=47872 RepID=A0A1C4V0B0_9ACTN|nr:MFS transporter [Micromonospora purpureochromogenes]SCE77433.1 Predicted arabinose efflux permease, MFS family [Micromonospora purpureochromogenes]